MIKSLSQKENLLSSSEFNSSNLKKAIERALKMAINLPKMWSLGDIETKRKIQYMLFLDGLGYDFENNRVRAFRVNSIFNVISSISDKKESKKSEINTIKVKIPLW